MSETYVEETAALRPAGADRMEAARLTSRVSGKQFLGIGESEGRGGATAKNSAAAVDKVAIDA